MKAAATTHNPTGQAKSPLKLVKGNQPEKIRAELNIEKWPAIWQPSKSKNKPALRTMQREVEMADGTRATSRLEVGYTQLGTVTTEDQKMFYALVKQWEDSGKPDTQIFFSDRLLQRLLKKKWGTNVIEAITSSLRRLRTTPFTWVNSYHHAASPKATFEEETFFTLLSDLKIVRRKVDGHVTNQQGYFQFDKNILINLLSNYTKPLFLEDLFRFESEIAQLIYVHVDLLLATKTQYERRTRELFDDLGLQSGSYRYASNRKQALVKAMTELEGVRLSTGVLKSITLEKTADGKDYKIIFRKVAASKQDLEALPAEQEPVPEQQGSGEVVVNHFANTDPFVLQAEELLQYFYKVFHGVENHYAQSKEISQALSLISQHGMEKAKHVVSFAHEAAAATKYLPQTFGGILQYVSRAVADFAGHQDAKAHTQQFERRQAEQFEKEQQERAREEARLAALTAEQYQERFERARIQLAKQYPFMARQKKDNKLHEGAIRALMIRQLLEENMELLVIETMPPAPNTD